MKILKFLLKKIKKVVAFDKRLKANNWNESSHASMNSDVKHPAEFVVRYELFEEKSSLADLFD